jgi:hypothetical protein
MMLPLIEMTAQMLVSRLIDQFERRRWRDVDNSALQIARAVEKAGGQANAHELARVPSRTFLDVNHVTRADLEEAVAKALRGVVLVKARPPLVPIEEINSFEKAGAVSPQAVAHISATKLPLAEQTVKEYVSRILGEPYLERDWGGELSDIVTTRVQLGGRRIGAAFLLKGKSFKKTLKPSDLGTNGDQIRRLSKQAVDLYVVQHVGQFDEAVYDQVRDMVVARRVERGEHIVGSVWDGSDCARLFVAHGLIDPATGNPLV